MIDGEEDKGNQGQMLGWFFFSPLCLLLVNILPEQKLRWVARTGGVWLLPSAFLAARVLLELKTSIRHSLQEDCRAKMLWGDQLNAEM